MILYIVEKKTTGVVDCSFKNDSGRKFKLVDVGGQRSERKKWASCFENVKALIFVSALSDYDLTCYEDNETNRLTESLTIFEDVVNGNLFKDKLIFLIFNKYDKFKLKLEKNPLENFFEGYDGDSVDSAVEFIKQLYLSRNNYSKDRIHIHLTTATEKDSIIDVIAKITDTLIKNNGK